MREGRRCVWSATGKLLELAGATLRRGVLLRGMSLSSLLAVVLTGRGAVGATVWVGVACPHFLYHLPRNTLHVFFTVVPSPAQRSGAGLGTTRARRCTGTAARGRELRRR